MMYKTLLKRAREAAGLSQEALAEMVGTSASTISDWERHEHQPSAYFRDRLCTVLKKSAVELGLLPPTERFATSPIYDTLLPLPAALIGRNETITQLRQHLLGSWMAYTVLLGLPGSGKTAVASVVASDQKIRKHFYDGILWIGLGPTPNLSTLFVHWGKLLGLSPVEMDGLSTREAWIGALRSAIGNRSLLLIIDDAWRVEDALSLRVGGSNCAYLLTTRFPSIASSLSIDGVTRIEGLSPKDGVALLRQLAPWIINWREEQKIEEIVQAVGGLPLALTLMGNYLRKQGYSGQSRRITDALERLSRVEERLHLSEMRAPIDHYPSLSGNMLSLHAMIAIVDHYLGEEAHQALRLLAARFLTNTFSEEEALTTEISLEALDALIDAGLLEWNSEGRYTLHQTIADYARLAAVKPSADDKD